MNTKSRCAQLPQVRAMLKEMRLLRDGEARRAPKRGKDGQILYDTMREALLKAFEVAA